MKRDMIMKKKRVKWVAYLIPTHQGWHKNGKTQSCGDGVCNPFFLLKRRILGQNNNAYCYFCNYQLDMYFDSIIQQN